jgi:hypothetical protein
MKVYLLTDHALGTGGVHFVSIELQLIIWADMGYINAFLTSWGLPGSTWSTLPEVDR